MAAADVMTPGAFQTSIPARLDRLPWSRWHWLVIIALGITWIIDGLEVTMIGACAAVLQEPDSLHFSATQIGLLGTSYLAGPSWARFCSATSPTGWAARSFSRSRWGCT